MEMGVAVKMVLFGSFTDTVEAQSWVLDSQYNGRVLLSTKQLISEMYFRASLLAHY